MRCHHKVGVGSLPLPLNRKIRPYLLLLHEVGRYVSTLTCIFHAVVSALFWRTYSTGSNSGIIHLVVPTYTYTTILDDTVSPHSSSHGSTPDRPDEAAMGPDHLRGTSQALLPPHQSAQHTGHGLWAWRGEENRRCLQVSFFILKYTYLGK